MAMSRAAGSCWGQRGGRTVIVTVGRRSDHSCGLQTRPPVSEALLTPMARAPSLHSSLTQELSNPVPPCLCPAMTHSPARPHGGMSSAASFLTPTPMDLSHITFNGLALSSSPTYGPSPVKLYDQFHAVSFSASPAFSLLYSSYLPALSPLSVSPP